MGALLWARAIIPPIFRFLAMITEGFVIGFPSSFDCLKEREMLGQVEMVRNRASIPFIEYIPSTSLHQAIQNEPGMLKSNPWGKWD
jgi:hypothetical protein